MRVLPRHYHLSRASTSLGRHERCTYAAVSVLRRGKIGSIFLSFPQQKGLANITSKGHAGANIVGSVCEYVSVSLCASLETCGTYLSLLSKAKSRDNGSGGGNGWLLCKSIGDSSLLRSATTFGSEHGVVASRLGVINLVLQETVSIF